MREHNMVRSLLIALVLIFTTSLVSAQTVLQGQATEDSREPLIGATVKVFKGVDFIRGTITNERGEYRVSLDPGTYDVEVTYSGYQTNRTTGVQVLAGKLNNHNIKLVSGLELADVVITAFKIPLIKQDETSTGQALTSDQIKNLPTRSLNQIVATTAGTSSVDGGAVSIKGGRPNATNYYVDGIRVSGSMPPVQDAEQLQVITGGLGAEYGDVTGGVISVITKGAASEYHGAIEVENSKGLDPYGWLLGTANISGPILKKKMAGGGQRTLIGFRMSGQYLDQKDDNAPAIPVYRAKQSVLNNLYENPLVFEKGLLINAGEQLTQDSVDVLKYNPNENRRDIDLTGKLDFRLADNLDMSFTGTFKDIQNQFTPRDWQLLNSQNNPTQYSQRYRGFGRLRHRLGSAEPSKKSGVSISNASYQLQFGFERATQRNFDPRHEDRLFDYGYLGRWDFDYVPVAGQDPVTNKVRHLDYRVQFTGFREGYDAGGDKTISPNPGLVNYNKLDINPEIYESYRVQNGFVNNIYDGIWSDMHANVNLVYNNNSKSQSDLITIMASTGFDLKLGKTGIHNIQIGMINEQRNERFWSMAPFEMWRLMEQVANQHFNGLDTNKVIGKFLDPFWSPILGDSITQYANDTVNLRDNKFYWKLRESLKVPIDEFVNVHTLRPDQIRLDFFAPRELTDNYLVSYYGYDHLGNPTPDGVTFNDFFTSRDADGVRNFPVAPLRPLYQAAYLKDKFTFNKMIFSLGVRVERLDLNTKVLRDPYSLYGITSAKEFYDRIPNLPQRPGTIGDDFKVYVESDQGTTIKAYRDGETWYHADGRQANDGSEIFGSKPVFPYLRDTLRIFDEKFDPSASFEDYTPQVNWMPRLAFSFPISEDANFFAHYDVLVQRPPDNWQVTPLNYAYFYNPSPDDADPVRNNANLKPERVVDYEVGFQQKLNEFSALKFSAYYRELRNMLQRRIIFNVPSIGQYETFDNVDFGTTKGFTVQYDLRRIQNLEMRLAGTLQFADGTGSNSNSQRNLSTRGNLRTLYPVTEDERFNFNATLDYRFASGKGYNGPRIGEKDILSNFGINLQMFAVSGRPYTPALRPLRFASSGRVSTFNGSRLPWRFNLDLRVDKSFNLMPSGKKPLNLNVYFRASNILNRKNVLGVYAYSGSPATDGYLTFDEGRDNAASIAARGRNIDAYLASYSWAMLNPGFYSLPRRMYVGAVIEF
jgi:outer membrane receptor protein involved in Fe transport